MACPPQLGSAELPAHRDDDALPLTQTAPDDEPEAEWSAFLGEKPQVRAVTHGAPGRIRTCDTRFRSLPWAGL